MRTLLTITTFLLFTSCATQSYSTSSSSSKAGWAAEKVNQRFADKR